MSQYLTMKARMLALLGVLAMLSGCVNPPQATTTTTLESIVKPTVKTLPATTLFGCTLSLCDCKCHPKGTTIEETTGRLCGINCAGEYNVIGCEVRDGSCVEVKSPKTTIETTMPGSSTTTLVQIANPASQKCVSDGGTLEIIDQSGGQLGICHFSDGTVCEEWAYFRNECAPGQCVCSAVGSRSEGWYCSGVLLYWSQCSQNSKAFRDCGRYAGAGACTMEYNPVCAKVNASGAVKWQTYGNGCSACASNASGETVMGYRPGECS
jgi:hypothetical protein